MINFEDLSLNIAKIQTNLDKGIIDESEAEQQLDYYLRNNDLDLADIFMLDELILSILEKERKKNDR